MSSSIHFTGFIASIYDTHSVEWNRILNQYNNDTTSNNLPMFYHHDDYYFDFNQFIIDSIHNTIDLNITYNNPQECVQFSFELSNNVVQLFNTNSFNIFIHPDYVDIDGTNNGNKYSNSSNQLSRYIQDICHKTLFSWKNKLSKKHTLINLEDVFDTNLNNILNFSMNQVDNHNILDDNILDDNISDTSSDHNSLYMQEQLSVD